MATLHHTEIHPSAIKVSCTGVFDIIPGLPGMKWAAIFEGDLPIGAVTNQVRRSLNRRGCVAAAECARVKPANATILFKGQFSCADNTKILPGIPILNQPIE